MNPFLHVSLHALRTGVVCLVALVMTAAGAYGQQVESTASVVASGGGVSSETGVTLRATVGQVGAQHATDPSFDLDAGFWPAVYISEQTSTAIDDEPTRELPSEYTLEAAYPNPFNPTTRIGYELPEAADVTLAVYNALGHRVEILVDRRQAPGTYDVAFTAEGLSSGTYYYRLDAGDYQETRPVTLVK